jgi:hypothetical protein
MKKIYLLCLVLTPLFCFSENEEVVINVDNIFIPKGFDSNDDSEITLTGYLPNTCYVRAKAKTDIVGEKIAIEVSATKVNDRNCIMAVVPFILPVKLGVLKTGTHDISVNTFMNSKITIAQPGSSKIDNFNYANITSVEKVDSTSVLLTGFHPSSCMEFDKVIMEFNDKNDTLSVMPIIKQNPLHTICDRRAVPFSYVVEIPKVDQRAAKDKVLVHVRKLDGNAVNILLEE